ncbi:MAG: phosphoribosylformylglycinamidine synthase subunit PurQ [Rhodothermaeota bacterium MED-G64]|nr:MAG: phosphoribosylformylglycinamidine synthase subunit PurQ [Rhodothermaeota bacterium MED-G64]RPF80315.1 MAG: phosphoribosylformylglycinamidine synthase subunit PurQ [Rhodothermaceae bacterium TMED105]HBD42111.1 phosphoribosylformylglycinamidine synthase I [Bacteroidota bacterium]|tara:strand:+ start:16556 stop:17257 length:702 start_codon:yes stop_codon:yes gene_type:complete
MNIAIPIFPGSNCDHDTEHVFGTVLGANVHSVWHKETSIGTPDMVIIPGGFSYGDYLRTGAIARFSPIMESIQDFAKKGGPVIGICNGFQILLEAGLLPGVMLHNENLRFICKSVHLKVEAGNQSHFTQGLDPEQTFKIPISHGEGNYRIDDDGLKSLEDHQQIVFRYVNELGELDPEANVNGSTAAIAGICNRQGNVLGLMPHPERAAEPQLGNADGRQLLDAFLQAVDVTV